MALGKLLAVGAIAALGYEGYKRYRLTTAKGFVMAPGHIYSLSFSAKILPAGQFLSQSDAQSALNASAPGLFNVISTPVMTPTGFSLSATYEGAVQTIDATHLTTGWNSAEVTGVTATNVQDNGSAPAVSPQAASTAGTLHTNVMILPGAAALT